MLQFLCHTASPDDKCSECVVKKKASKACPSKSSPVFRFFTGCQRENVETVPNCKAKPPSFLRLAKERRFDEIVSILQHKHQLSESSSSSSSAATTAAATDAWLKVSQGSRVSSCESLHALCMYRPTGEAVQAVLDALETTQQHHHRNNTNNNTNKNQSQVSSFVVMTIDATLVVDAAGRTPLHIAAACGCSIRVVEVLVRSGIGSGNSAVSTRDHAGRYPLHWACAKPNGHSKKTTDNMVMVITYLIEAYALAVIAKDQKGQTPMQLAMNANADDRIIKALQFVTKILPPDCAKDSNSESTEETLPIPREAFCFLHDDEDAVSSLGSRGVSRHGRRGASPKRKVPNLIFL